MRMDVDIAARVDGTWVSSVIARHAGWPRSVTPGRIHPRAPKPSAKRRWSLHDRLDERDITELITTNREDATAVSLVAAPSLRFTSVKRLPGVRRDPDRRYAGPPTGGRVGLGHLHRRVPQVVPVIIDVAVHRGNQDGIRQHNQPRRARQVIQLPGRHDSEYPIPVNSNNAASTWCPPR
jgi:hypothetical protein